MKTKRGSHVGRVLSFVIFITFIVFFYSAIQPAIKVNQNNQNLLDYLEVGLKDSLSIQIKSFSVSLDSSPRRSCLRLENFMENLKGLNAVIKDSEENPRNAYYLGNYLFLDNPLKKDFFKVYYSEDLNQIVEGSLGHCDRIRGDKYEVGFKKTDEKISEKKIFKLIENYELNYSKIKEDFNIPAGSNFGIIFEDSEGELFETQSDFSSGDVYAEEHPIQYFTEDAEIKSGFLTIQVW